MMLVAPAPAAPGVETVNSFTVSEAGGFDPWPDRPPDAKKSATPESGPSR